MNVRSFRNAVAILHNLSLWELEEAGVIARGNSKAWSRFNDDITTFILKLGDKQLEALWGLVQARQPDQYKEAAL